MKRVLRAVLIVGGVIGLITFTFVSISLTQQPLDELTGLSDSTFDDDARGTLPASASRILRYTTGFTDSATWIAYTADQSYIERMIEAECGRPIVELEDWDPSRSFSFSRPARDDRWHRGYWDTADTEIGKTYSRFEGSHGVDILVDTERWRVFIHKYST